jgi:hypothetical protein
MVLARRGSMVVVALIAGWSLACGLTGTPEQRANRDACEAYVDHMNGLTTCLGVSYDVDNICAGANDEPPAMREYYDCLRENSSCDGLDARLELDSCAAKQPIL